MMGINPNDDVDFIEFYYKVSFLVIDFISSLLYQVAEELGKSINFQKQIKIIFFEK